MPALSAPSAKIFTFRSVSVFIHSKYIRFAVQGRDNNPGRPEKGASHSERPFSIKKFGADGILPAAGIGSFVKCFPHMSGQTKARPRLFPAQSRPGVPPGPAWTFLLPSLHPFIESRIWSGNT